MTTQELNYKLHNERFDNCYKVDATGRPYDIDLSFEMISCIIDADLSASKENKELKRALKVAKIQMQIQDLENELDALVVVESIAIRNA